MDWLWTWGGACFGYREGVELFTYDGKHVGRFVANDVFDPSGNYIGEVINENRLIRNNAKGAYRSSPFTPQARRAGFARYAAYVGYAMYAGHSDFPLPETFR